MWKNTSKLKLRTVYADTMQRAKNATKKGRPVVPYGKNSNQRRVQRTAGKLLQQLAGGSAEDGKALLIDLSEHNIHKETSKADLLVQLRTNIQSLFSSLPPRSPLRPAILATLTEGLSLKDSKDLTGYSFAAVNYARSEQHNTVEDVLANASVNVGCCSGL